MLRLAPIPLALSLFSCATDAREPYAPGAAAWSVEGTWTDACCCKVPCPCLFGTGATEGYCEGASVLEIREGECDGVPLNGLNVLVVYHVGQWSRLIVDVDATDEQVGVATRLVPELLPYLRKGTEPTVCRAPVDIRHDGTSIEYGSADTCVRLELLESANGEPIVLQNLPAKGTPFPAAHEHVQYTSRTLQHNSESGAFAHTDRNGFRSKLDLSGEFQLVSFVQTPSQGRCCAQ